MVGRDVQDERATRAQQRTLTGRSSTVTSNILNGGQLIVDYLIRAKVPYAFGLCGHGNISFIDALYERAADITTISVHHETVAGFMADVYYRVSGQPTATFTSCGPGSANLPICLANSFFDSVPFLAVTGNVPTNQFNRGAFQETYRHYQADFPSTVRAYCKRVFQPTRGEQVPVAIRQAWKTMVTGRPGPVVLDVPFDVFKEAATEETPRPEDWSANISCRCGADPEGVRTAVDMMLGAERPVILVGQGVKYGQAAAELLTLAERLGIPVACSASGIGAIDSTHPLALGLVARNGTYQANHAARQADVLLALGVRFDDRTSSSWIPGYSFTIPPTRLIHVDIDPDEIARNYPVALGLMADVRTFLRQVLAELDGRPGRAEIAPERQVWLASIEGYRKEWAEFIAPGFSDGSTPIHPQRAAHEIDRALPEEAILVSDIGIHHNWLIQFCRPRRPDSLIGSMGFGPMGFGVCGALGAKLAAPERPCVSVCGDGAFLMHPSVLGTAVEYQIPVVWVVWNNYAYASIRGLQRGYLEGRELATDFKHPETGEPYNPDFAAMARSAGVEGVSVDRPGDLADAVRAGLASGRPYLIDANIGADRNPAGAGVWELPGLGCSKPAIGGRYQPGAGFRDPASAPAI
jgi:acetolactate synthase-1/2/3 large subunit